VVSVVILEAIENVVVVAVMLLALDMLLQAHDLLLSDELAVERGQTGRTQMRLDKEATHAEVAELDC